MPLIRNTIFLISKCYSVVHKMLSLIGNEVWGLNRDTQLKATDSLNIHVQGEHFKMGQAKIKIAYS